MQYPLDEIVKYCYCNEMSGKTTDPKGFIERVEAAREKKGLGRYEFSEAIGQGSSYWSVWINRHRERGGFPKGDIMDAMVRVLGVDMDYLLGRGEGSTVALVPEIQTAPLAELLRRINARSAYGQRAEDVKGAAGTKKGRLPQDYDDSRLRKRLGKGDLPERIQLIEVEGECMLKALYPGDVVLVDTQQTPEIGKIVVAVRFYDEVLVKFLREKDGHQYFESMDKKIVIPFDQYTRILGPVIDVQRSIDRILAEL